MKRLSLFIRAAVGILLAFACDSAPEVAASAAAAANCPAAQVLTVSVGTAVVATGCIHNTPTGGSTSIGGAPGTGGALTTGGKASTGGSSASPGNLSNCIAALSKDAANKNVAAQQGITVKSLATKECTDPNILSRYP